MDLTKYPKVPAKFSTPDGDRLVVVSYDPSLVGKWAAAGKPEPGTPEAVAAGCPCPPLDGPSVPMMIHTGCPVHLVHVITFTHIVAGV